jgi:DNA-directed RNA polymerase specialized sigma24 family protein
MSANRLKPLVRPNDRRAVVALLSRYYPHVYRMAIALSGSESIARDVTRTVLRQGLRALPRWANETDVARWFAHHTVLTLRQIPQNRFDPAHDPLLDLTTDPIFTTIFRTLRFLPPQKREAFLLHHGEGFDLRQLATAMDCSSEAAANHLVAAAAALQPVAADRLGEFTAILPQLLARLLPPEDKISLEIHRQTRRHLRPRRLKQWVAWPLLLSALALIAWALWRLFPMIVT